MRPVPGGRGRSADELRPELRLTRDGLRVPPPESRSASTSWQSSASLTPCHHRLPGSFPPTALSTPRSISQRRKLSSAPVAAAFPPRVLAAVELGGQAVSIRGTVT